MESIGIEGNGIGSSSSEVTVPKATASKCRLPLTTEQYAITCLC